MKTVILCGGLGTRLREETEFRPKTMVQIGGHPILWHIMQLYAHHGFNEFVLCLGHRGDDIKQYFLNYPFYHSDFTIEVGRPGRAVEFHGGHHATGWRVTCVDTGLQTQTGARLKRVAGYVPDDTFLFTYGDGVANVDLKRLMAFHRSHGKIATVTGVHPPSRFGELLVQGERVQEFSEKPLISEGRINGGFFVLQRRIFDYLSDEELLIFERGPLERLAKDGQLMMYAHDGFWQCLDTPRDLQLLTELWAQGRPPWKVWDSRS
ncbi:MAG: glucose-1-phosphate cytidylyltransferase [Candidatus Omnitrophica bacterium]|nr:glucose-1-phosphate cytidylyltransferase [Candidatus Omnitrophota bacterium]